MKRTKGININKTNTAENNLTLLSMMARMFSSQYLGRQYTGDRDLYEALGYPKEISFDEYFAQYMRQDIAAAVINRPAEKTWKGQVNIFNPEDESDTLRKAWKTLYKKLKLKDKFVRIDKLGSVGQFAVLLLGFNDITVSVKKTTQKTTMSDPVKGTNLQLKYVYPYCECGYHL